MKILVVRDIEREDVDFLCKSLGCKPIANVDSFTADKLGIADCVEEISMGASRVVKVTGAQVTDAKTVTILVRGSNKLVLEEADRSIHDALCVVRCLVKKRALIAGGGGTRDRDRLGTYGTRAHTGRTRSVLLSGLCRGV